MTLLRQAVTAPCAPFDRWTVEFVPLHVAQRCVRTRQEVQQLAQQHPDIFHTLPQDKKQGGNEDDNREAAATGESDCPAAGAARLNRLAPDINVGNWVHAVDWDRVRADSQTRTRAALINFSMGYDAYITRRFDTTRRNHPQLCSNRIQNKMVYGVMGLLASARCRTLRPMVPMVCVPRVHTRPLPQTAATATDRGENGSLREMTSLQLPSSCKALVMTNISKYASGGQPWQSKFARTFHRPVNLKCDKLARIAAPAASSESGSCLTRGARAADHPHSGEGVVRRWCEPRCRQRGRLRSTTACSSCTPWGAC